jgi:ATP-binding cassette subfamily B protein
MFASGLERDLARLAALEVNAPDPFEPVGVAARSGPPRARIDPDRAKGWLRRLLPVLRSHAGPFALALACSLLGLVIQVAVPRVLMAAIDTALATRAARLGTFVWVLAALAVLRGGTAFVARYWLFKVAYAIEYDLRVSIYEHLTRLSFSFYDSAQSGQLVSRANSDIRALQMFLTFGPLLALNVVSIALALALMVTTSLPLTLVAVAPLPVVLWLGIRMRERMFPASWLTMARQAEVATLVEENVAGVRVVRSFAAEEQQIAELARRAQRLRWAELRQVEVDARYSPLLEDLPRLGMAAVLLLGGLLALEGRLGIGAIVAFSAYVVMLQTPFRFLGFILMMGQRAAASAHRIYQVLDVEPEITDRPGAVALTAPRGEVEFQEVRFGYGDGPDVLQGFSLHLRPGETVALVGRTGSGKSTVARLLPRFYDVRSGCVRIDGRDVRDLTLASLRHHVGVVLDEPFLFSASIRDNIAFGRPGAPLDEVVAAARAAGALEFIEELPAGLDEVIGERGYTLSGGQRQRIAIARTLLVNPRVLVLDDATSAIDVKVEERIHDALRTLMRGRTTLVIAHRLSTIGLAERVALLEGGRVVASGRHAELMGSEPRYRDVLAHLAEDEDAHLGAIRRARAGPVEELPGLESGLAEVPR